MLAVQSSGKNPCRCGFAYSAHSRKQEGVSNAFALDGILERSCDSVLAYDLFESLRSPLPCQNLIVHWCV